MANGPTGPRTPGSPGLTDRPDGVMFAPTPAERRTWRDAVYAVIEAMTTRLPQGELTIERMCALAGVSRAGYYRTWAASAPRAANSTASAWAWATVAV